MMILVKVGMTGFEPAVSPVTGERIRPDYATHRW